VICSGTAGLKPGTVGTEEDRGDPAAHASPRLETEDVARAFADRGVRSAVVRLPPTVHGDGDHGFTAVLVDVARRTGVAGYVGDGANRWPAVHRSDAGRLVAKALENPGAAHIVHAVGEEGIAARAIAEAIGRGAGVPVASIAPQDAEAHFGWIGRFFALDIPASSALTQERFDWRPTGPTLLEDLAAGHYFERAAA
jgi:nucleoside-diphosphate-sugar epimerase